MRGDAGAGAALVGMAGLDQEVVVMDRADDAVLTDPWFGHLCRAFDDLGEVPGETGIAAAHQRDRREQRRVARSPGDYYLGAVGQRLRVWLDPIHRDDRTGQRRGGKEGVDPGSTQEG